MAPTWYWGHRATGHAEKKTGWRGVTLGRALEDWGGGDHNPPPKLTHAKKTHHQMKQEQRNILLCKNITHKKD